VIYARFGQGKFILVSCLEWRGNVRCLYGRQQYMHIRPPAFPSRPQQNATPRARRCAVLASRRPCWIGQRGAVVHSRPPPTPAPCIYFSTGRLVSKELLDALMTLTLIWRRDGFNEDEDDGEAAWGTSELGATVFSDSDSW